MYSFLNYNFCGDAYALDATPTSTEQFVNLTLSNGIFHHVRLSKTGLDIDQGDIPTAWTVNTILDCNFEENIAGGNIEATAALLTDIRIKRRVSSTPYADSTSFNWVTLEDYPVEDISSFSFTFYDTYARNGETYDYALVPVMGNIEGEYIISSVKSQFDAMYLSDATGIYSLKGNLTYGDTEFVNLTGTVEPIGSKYPITVSNSETAYHRGSVTGILLPKDYYEGSAIDGQQNIKYKTLFENFLHNGQAKIFKDWNGNYYLIMMEGSPSISYLDSTANEMFNVNFTWVEVGDPYDQSDLYNNGLVEVAE